MTKYIRGITVINKIYLFWLIVTCVFSAHYTYAHWERGDNSVKKEARERERQEDIREFQKSHSGL